MTLADIIRRVAFGVALSARAGKRPTCRDVQIESGSERFIWLV
jgi:hypothetical protein